jgi:hypothetical protein
LRVNLNVKKPYDNEYHEAEAFFATRMLLGLACIVIFNGLMFWLQILCTNNMDLPLFFSFTELGV